MSNQETEPKVSEPEYSGVMPLPTIPVRVPDASVSDTVFLSGQEAELAKRILSNPAQFPEAFKSWVVQYLAVNQELIPQSLVNGLAPFNVSGARIPTSGDAGESTSSTSFTNLTTTGPELQLGAGLYALFFGCHALGAGGPIMSLSVNGATATDADSVSMTGASGISISRVLLSTLSDPNNTVVAKYRSNAGTSVTFYRRFLVALRYGKA